MAKNHLYKKLQNRLKITNKPLILLTASDVFTWGIYEAISGLVGVYLFRKIGGNVEQYVGFGIFAYKATNAAFQIPVGKLIDHIKGYLDEAIVLAGGNMLMGLPFIMYPLMKSPSTFYVLQILFGIGTTLNLVSWRKLFAKNLNKGKEGIEYAEYGTVIGVSIALFSGVAGLITGVSQKYFDIFLVGSGVIMMLSSFLSIYIYKFNKTQ